MFPTFNQFSRWAGRYRVVPIWIEPELPSRDLLDWVHSLTSQEQKFFFLHSASQGSQSRYSYIALDAPRYHVEANDDTLTLRYRTGSGSRAGLPTDRQEAIKIGNPYERFHGWFSQLTGPRVEALPPFWGGAVGYLGYESSGH